MIQTLKDTRVHVAVGKREEESEETQHESDYNPPQCRCTFL